MDIIQINAEELERFLGIMKDRSGKWLKFLGKAKQHFDVVFNTEIGQVLLKKYVDRFAILNAKIEKSHSENIPVDDLTFAEFIILRGMLQDEVELINKYLEKVKKVVEIASSR